MEVNLYDKNLCSRFYFLVVSLVTLTAVDNNNKKTSGGNGGNVVDVNKKMAKRM